MQESSVFRTMLEAGHVDIGSGRFRKEVNALVAESRAAGRLMEARGVIYELGYMKFSSPVLEHILTINGLHNLETAHTVLRRILTAESWQELLAEEPDH
jgi:hypothetical protein